MDEGAGRPLPTAASPLPSVGDAKRTLSISWWLVDGPKVARGQGRKVVAALVEGRRAWLERVHAEGGTFKSGRKTGSAWVTEPMRERAREEARKLTGGWSPPFGPPDHKLVLALLRSAKGCPQGEGASE